MTKEIEEYVMTVMTFGSTCSPYCAQYVKNKNASEFATEYPRAVGGIVENHYVDDYLDSVDSESEAIELAKTVKLIHSKAGFEIHNFMSNSKKVLSEINSDAHDDSSKKITVWNGINDAKKILGMWWSPQRTYSHSSSKPISSSRVFYQGRHAQRKGKF